VNFAQAMQKVLRVAIGNLQAKRAAADKLMCMASEPRWLAESGGGACRQLVAERHTFNGAMLASRTGLVKLCVQQCAAGLSRQTGL
jgi:hypothetical protein